MDSKTTSIPLVGRIGDPAPEMEYTHYHGLVPKSGKVESEPAGRDKPISAPAFDSWNLHLNRAPNGGWSLEATAFDAEGGEARSELIGYYSGDADLLAALYDFINPTTHG